MPDRAKYKTTAKAEPRGTKQVPGVPPVPGEGESVQMVIAQAYGGFSAERLGEEWRKVDARLREVEEEIASSDARLQAAAVEDERLWASGGSDADRAGEPFKLFSREQARTVALIPRKWQLEKHALALELACRYQKDAEVECELRERAPIVAEKEQQLAALQAELDHLRAQQGDVTQERYGLVPNKHTVARYEDLCSGPRTSGLSALLTNKAGGAQPSHWSEHRIEF